MSEGYAFKHHSTVALIDEMNPWPEGSGSLFGAATRFGLGEGELAATAALLGISVSNPNDPELLELLRIFVSGQKESFDISITRERIETARGKFPSLTAWCPQEYFLGKKIEIKKPGVARQVRVGAEGMISVMEGYTFFRRLADDIAAAHASLNELLELLLPPDTHDSLGKFVAEDVPMIARGVMSKGRVFGSELGGSKQGFGLLQATRALANVKRAKLNLEKWRQKIHFKDTGLWLTAHARHVVNTLKVFELSGERLATAISKLGLTPLQADMLIHLDNPAFTDPEIIKGHWSTLALPSRAFDSVDLLCLVSEKGFMPLRREKLDSLMTLAAISQGGRPTYKVNEDVFT